MKTENISLLRELCYIIDQRNAINHRRTKARWRRAYYKNAIKVTEAFKESNAELRKLNKQIDLRYKTEDMSEYMKRRDKILDSMFGIRYRWDRVRNTPPNKWLNMGPMKLRALALKAEAEYAQAKYKTMVLSEKTSKRVKVILKELDAYVVYNNGYVTAISPHHERSSGDFCEDRGEIAEYAKQHELAKAMDRMLRNK